MRLFLALAFIFFCSLTSEAHALPSADAIVANYVKAIGGQDACDAIQNVIIRGVYTENGQSDDHAVLARMRPFYKLVGDPLHRSTEFEEGYDGSAWEFYGEPGMVLRTVGPAAAAARHGLYILGNLVDYKKQGSTVTLIGTAKIAGRDTFQLRVRMMDGFEQDEFVDAKTWLVIADRKVAKVHAFGADVPSETRWSDYRRVNGVLFAFHNNEVEIATGKVLNDFQATSIEANAKLDPAVFAPPVLTLTPVQALISHLYQERDDVAAVLWTYHDFRAAYPTADTDEAMQIAGYQMLKMSAVASAVALLAKNVEAYPQSSDAAFAYGRATQTAGDLATARSEFQRALTLNPKNARATKALAAMDAPKS